MAFRRCLDSALLTMRRAVWVGGYRRLLTAHWHTSRPWVRPVRARYTNNASDFRRVRLLPTLSGAGQPHSGQRSHTGPVNGHETFALRRGLEGAGPKDGADVKST